MPIFQETVEMLAQEQGLAGLILKFGSNDLCMGCIQMNYIGE